jgi:pimeloyl-ACP methyl ester carboxylesterase
VLGLVAAVAWGGWLPAAISRAQLLDLSPPESVEEAVDQLFHIPGPTLGGTQLWSDELIYHGWRIQRNALTDHCRLLDEKDVRRAWGSFPQCRDELTAFRREANLPPMSGRVVLLLHGLGRSRNSMRPLGDYLQEHSELTSLEVTYATTRRTLKQHAESLARVIGNLDPEVREINFVCHSLGNLVVRQYLHDYAQQHPGQPTDPRIRRMVMLGPPNRGAQFATWVADQAVAKWLVGSVLGTLAENGDGTPASSLSIPAFEFGIIAGGKGDGEGLNPALKGDDDFVVTVEEAKLPGAHDFVVVPVYHGIIMNDAQVQRMTLNFLTRGFFLSGPRRHPLPRAGDAGS